jgi:uncharacterized alpha-E superfamily protein
MLLSRVGDTLYWISRYLERAEHTSRLLDVRLDLGLGRRQDADRWDFSCLYAALRLADAAHPRALPRSSTPWCSTPRTATRSWRA